MIDENLIDHPALEAAFRASWGLDTCDPADLEQWTPANPSRGQCGVTALVVQDHLGGRLVLAEVTQQGERVGVHYWSELPDGTQVDLTRRQFLPDEVVGEPTFVDRPPGTPINRCAEQYELLTARVAAVLRASGAWVGAQVVDSSRSRSYGPVPGVATGESSST